MNLRRRFPLLAPSVLAIVAALVIWAITGGVTTAVQPVNVYRVQLRAPLTSGRALDLLNGLGVTPIYLGYRYVVAGHLAAGEVAVLPAADQAARISIEHDGSVRDRVNTIAGQRASVSAEGAAALEEHLATTKAALGALAPNRPVIVNAMVLANDDGLQRLGRDPLISGVATITRTTARGSTHHGLASPMNELASGYVPSEGYVVVQPSAQGGRYVQQTFIWYSGRTLDFGAWPTDPQGYEADFFASTNNGTYLDSSSTFSIPNVITWNWDYNCTYPYLDSRAGDSSDANAFTIGCSDAYHLVTGQWYSTYIRTNNGPASDDRGFVTPQSQHGGSGCGTTWCFAPTATCLIGGPGGTYPIFIPTSSYHWYLSSGCY